MRIGRAKPLKGFSPRAFFREDSAKRKRYGGDSSVFLDLEVLPLSDQTGLYECVNQRVRFAAHVRVRTGGHDPEGGGIGEIACRIADLLSGEPAPRDFAAASTVEFQRPWKRTMRGNVH